MDLNDEKTLIVIDDEGNEEVMEILFTFDDDTYNQKYVLYVNPKDETGEVFASRYTDDGILENVDDEAEWAMIEEVFNAFVDEFSKEHVHDHEEDDHEEHSH